MRVDRSRLPDIGSDPSFTFPAIVTHRLHNGLDVRTVEHHTVPVITFILQVSDGSAADPPDRHGLAALAADMLDEGTGDLSAIDVSAALARIGAEFDTDVGADATALSVTTLTRFAERGLRLLADIVTRPSLRGEDFDRIRQLRLDRLRQLRDVPPAVADRAFLRLVYQEHPYGHLAIGSDAALRAAQLEEVRDFHDRVYRPSHATLIVVGALTHDAMRIIAERAFGEWRDPTVRSVSGWPNPLDDEPPLVPAARLAVVPREAAAQSELRLGHLSARRDTPDYPALVVMNAVLGGQFVSRVNLKLREEKGYTYGARTGFDWRRGLAPFSLQASVHTAATADAIKDSLNELSAIRGARPVEEREMTLAKATLTRGYPRNFETTQQVARSIAQLALYDLPDTYFEEFVPRVNAIDAEDVTRAARSYLDPSRIVTLIVGDHRAIGGSLASLQLGEPAVLSPDV
jgi:zinc protease